MCSAKSLNYKVDDLLLEELLPQLILKEKLASQCLILAFPFRARRVSHFFLKNKGYQCFFQSKRS